MSTVSISPKAEAIHALYTEFKQLEDAQIKVGEEMAVLIFKQMQLAEKCRIINEAIQRMM